MTLVVTPPVVIYLVAGIVSIVVAAAVDIRRRRISWLWLLLPLLLGPPGGMAYFIARPPRPGD